MSFYHNEAKVGLEIEAGSFLGGENDIVVAGSSGGRSYVKFFEYRDGELWCDSSKEVAGKSSCTSMEVCEDKTDGRVYVGLALTRGDGVGGGNRRGSSLLMHDFMSDAQSPVGVSTKSAVSALSFSSDLRVMAAASECGNVSLFDFPTMGEFRTCRVDPCGVNDAKFDRNGQLIIAGRSAVEGPQVWDTRQAGEHASVSCMGPASVLFGGVGMGAGGSNQLSNTPTCVLPHPVKDTVYTGSENGVVSEWDIRKIGPRPVQSVQMHSERVSALVVHPTRPDAVVSASTDGTVHSVFLPEDAPSFSFEVESPVVAMDVHEVSGRLLVASAFGGTDLFIFEE